MRYRLHELLKEERKKTLGKGQVIQTTDTQTAFNLLNKGYVKRYMISNTGALNTEVIYGPGDIFPLTMAFKAIYGKDINDGPEVYYYETMTAAELHSVDTQQLLEKIQGDPLIYKSLFLEAGTRLHSTLNSLENLALRTSYRRVAHELLFLAKRFGQEKSEGVRIDLPLTHQDLADLLSLTRETVSNSMGELRRKGLVITNRRIYIPDMKKLEEEAFG